MTEIADFKKKLGGSVGEGVGGTATEEQYSDLAFVHTIAADDAMASTTTANTKIWTNPFSTPVRIVGVKYSANGTITASDTTYATIDIRTDDGAAGTPAVAYSLATTTTGSGNVVAHVAESFTAQSTAVDVPVGGCVWYSIAKASTGVVVRAGQLALKLRKV